MIFHPKTDWLARLIFQLKILKYEFVKNRSIVYLDKRGFATDAPRNKRCSLKGDVTLAKIGMLEKE